MARKGFCEFAQPIPGVSPVVKAQLRSAAFRGNSFSLAKGNELLYRFMQSDAFNREDRTQKAVNGFVQGVAIQLFGRLAEFRHGRQQGKLAPGVLPEGFEPFQRGQGVVGLCGTQGGGLAAIGYIAGERIGGSLCFTVCAITRHSPLAGHVRADPVERVSLRLAVNGGQQLVPVLYAFWEFHALFFGFGHILCGICAVNAFSPGFRGRIGCPTWI